jgi:hypothetical protein
MIDFLFNALGQDQVFEILASKLRSKVINPFNRRRSSAVGVNLSNRRNFNLMRCKTHRNLVGLVGGLCGYLNQIQLGSCILIRHRAFHIPRSILHTA